MSREHHGLEAHRYIVFIAQRDLAFGVGPQPRQFAVLAHLRLALHQPVRQRDGCRHEHIGFAGGVAEHQALIPGALLALVLTIDALRDVRRLLADDIEHPAAGTVEAHVRGVVPNIQHGLANQGFHIHPSAGGDLTGDDHHAGFDQGLAGHPAARIRRQDGVQHGVRNLVGDLVGVTLGNRFRRE
jgi:hypothetical protein